MKYAVRAGPRPRPVKERGFGLAAADLGRTGTVEMNGKKTEIGHGAVVIAAITSCTNTSNPSVMLGAGLLAKKADERGLRPPAYVKTSLAPGSKVVTEYYKQSGLLPHLENLGLQRGGLRLHDLHRQQRTSPRRRAQGGHRRQARGLVRALGQSQLRGPHQPGREGELPGLAPARGGLRAGRLDRDRPHQGAAGHGPRRQARLPLRHLADPAGGRGAGGAHQRRRCSRPRTPTSSTATRPGTR